MTNFANNHANSIDHVLGGMAALIGGLITGRWSEVVLAFMIGTLFGLLSGFYLGVKNAKEARKR